MPPPEATPPADDPNVAPRRPHPNEPAMKHLDCAIIETRPDEILRNRPFPHFLVTYK
jgi:hypothetical protein